MAANPEVRVALLTAADEAELLEFEEANREYFARTVGDRGDEYFAAFSRRHRSLVAENAAGTSMLFVVRDGDGGVVGRVNIGEIEGDTGELGYRFSEHCGGRGYARTAVRQALRVAGDRGLTRVTAMTTAGNVASQRVLEANGFERVPDGVPAEVEHGGRVEAAVHFVRRLAEPGR